MDHNGGQPLDVNTLMKCSLSSLVASQTGEDIDTASYSTQREKSSENIFFFFIKKSQTTTFKILV